MENDADSKFRSLKEMIKKFEEIKYEEIIGLTDNLGYKNDRKHIHDIHSTSEGIF